MVGEIVVIGVVVWIGGVARNALATRRQARRDDERTQAYINQLNHTSNLYRGRMESASDSFLNKIRETTRR